ncbi:peptidylprolyl isomerase [bacterium]|nr:peptidylprolyl isomerase [bacterium]
MIRLGLAALAVVAVTACQPAFQVDAADPYATLYPWKADLEGVKTTESGLSYYVVARGPEDGPSPQPTDRVKVNYDGRFAADGKQFDESYSSEPATFRLNQVIAGWTEGLQLMKPGDQFMFNIPYDLAYGEMGRPPAIPAKSDLMFRVELLDVIQTWSLVTPWPTDSAKVTRTASGLEYLVVSSGDPSGATATTDDFVMVNYEGRLDDGEVFDSSFDRGRPATFPVGDLIPGWVEFLTLMKPGDHWMVRLPSDLAYGAEGNGRIPPNSPLTFEVELMGVAPASAVNAPPPQPVQ